GVVWLSPAKANNTWAIVTTKEFAEQNNLTTMSDFAEYVEAGKDVKLAASDEFFNNVDAWPAFVEVYGIDLSQDQRVVFSGGNTAQTEKAVADGTDGVNFGMAYGTDGALADLGLVVLTDDQEAQLVYWPAPIIRKATLDQYPEIEALLKPVFDSLTLEKLQELNGRIQVNGENPEDVSRAYLTENGFIK
ncbi:MAG TPA: glycine betaine ABC transporter substrate-binding protein, partial [Coriobacteriia bacterium]|nr:glycine betaine ABC transporter substrate-binding protein [Coriobacteriia bacterium]